MSLTRRGFLSGILAAGVAPVIIKAENTMKIFVPRKEIILESGRVWNNRPHHTPNSWIYENDSSLLYPKWYRDGIPIPGATGDVYFVTNDDFNKTITISYS